MSGNRTPSRSFEDCDAIQHTHTACKYLDLESNQDLDFRRVLCDPLHHRDMGPTTGFAPASSGLQDRRLSRSSHVGKARAQGFEPCPSVLEADCSPRSTLAFRVTERNRTAVKRIHSPSPDTSTGPGHSGRRGSRTLKAFSMSAGTSAPPCTLDRV